MLKMILPREHETPFNKAPVIRAMAALLMVIAILSAVTRLVTRVLTIHALRLDDILVATSTVLAIAQSIAVIAEGANGMGKISVSSEQTTSILKAQYASDILYITVLLTAKLSATRTIFDMAPRNRRPALWGTEGLIALWGVSAIALSIFACPLPEAWDYIGKKCLDQSAIWIYIDMLNIVTDLLITGILVTIFMNMKTTGAKKALVIGVFGCRVFIIPPIISHMWYYRQAIRSDNPIFTMWQPQIIKQVIQCMSVMATCIPYLKPFMDSLDSGQMRAGDLLGGTRSKSGNSKSGGYASQQGTHLNTHTGKTSRGISSVATMTSNMSNRRNMYEMIDMDKGRGKGKNKAAGQNTATVTTACEPGQSWDGQSHTSQTVLVESSWRVEVESKRSLATIT